MLEEALSIDCNGVEQIGILHRPAQDRARRSAVLIVVGGGPQYRVGGHRQLLLWSRALAAEGFAVLRFDYRGMGDTAGDFKGFLNIDDDIRCAVDRLWRDVPGLEEIVLWGECDASSAILLYAGLDPRVKAAVLLNPWVRTEALQAQAVLKHYYWQRLRQPSFWRKLFGGGLNPLRSLRDAWQLWQQSRSGTPLTADKGKAVGPIPRQGALPDMLLQGLQRFEGDLMLVMSGRDLIAREFDQVLQASPEWRAALQARRALRHDLPEGDHTFSSAALRNQVLEWAMAWLKQRGTP